MAGWLIGNTADFSSGERRAILLMAIAPDIDGVFVLGPVSWREWHRTLGHNIFLGLAAPLIALFFLKKERRKFLLPFLFGAMLSHFLLDLFVTGWWTLMPFWPVSDWDILMSRWIPEHIMKYYIQIGLFILFLIPTIYIAVRFRRTPVEVFGEKADRFFLNFIALPFHSRCKYCNSRAFYRCEECNAPLCGKHRKFTPFPRVKCKN